MNRNLKIILNIETYNRYSRVDDEEQKKVKGVFCSSFKTYTRYYGKNFRNLH